MSGPLPAILIGASLVFALVALAYVALDRTPDWGLLGLAGLIEVGVLTLLVVAGFSVSGAGLGATGAVTLFGYLLAGLVVLPLGFGWSLAERSRGATTVLVVAGLTEAFLVVRVIGIWQA